MAGKSNNHTGSRFGGKSPGKKLRTSLPRPQAERPIPPRKEAERVAKVIARAGLGSRREIEGWIEAGRVSVNDEVITSPARNVGERDRITVDGKPLPERERTRLFLYHKPRGLVTTHADPEGRPTIFAALPHHLPRLISIGRLDINTEGLLLLTNDGGLARVLELPETGWLRRYRVRALGEVTQADLDPLRKGITVEGIHYGAIEATLDRQQGANSWITFAIREGKNREVRNVLGALHLQVNRLIRVSYGPFQLGDLKEGDVEEIPTRTLREQLGERVATLAAADFSGPATEAAPERFERATRFDDRRVEEKRARRILDSRPRQPEDDEREETRPPRRGRHERQERRRDDEPFPIERPKESTRKGKTRPHFSATRVWREEAKPLRRKFHGGRSARDDSKPQGEMRSGEIAGRGGRAITVERWGTPKREEEPRGRQRFGRRFESRDEEHGRSRAGKRFERDPGERRRRDDNKPRGEMRRGETADRAGRAVTAERWGTAKRAEKPRGRQQSGRGFERDEGHGRPRPGKRFERDAGERRPRNETNERKFGEKREHHGKGRSEKRVHHTRGRGDKGPRRGFDRGSGPRPSRPRPGK
jgi:23S rRNA pseudouridine2605 synthase